MQHEVLPGRVSKVANRYRPVDPTPETTTAPWIVILASACVIGLGALWGARDLEGWVGGKEGLFAQDAWMAVAGGLNTAAEQTGVASARALVDGWVAPLQHTAPVLARPDPVIDPDVEPIASLAESQDTDAVDTDLPPGARWVGPAMAAGRAGPARPGRAGLCNAGGRLGILLHVARSPRPTHHAAVCQAPQDGPD